MTKNVIMRVCRGCTTEFAPKRKGQEYHSRSCYLKSTLKLIICPEDGKKFQRKFSGQVCCSPECAFSYRAKKNTKGDDVSCTLCGKLFHKMWSRIRKYNFCNVEHRAAYAKSDKNKGMGINWHHTKEAKEKIRQANFNKDYNVIFTKETRRKLAEGARKKGWTDESKEKLRQANLGKNLSEEHKQKIRASSPKGEENNQYKGDAATYEAKHIYATSHRSEEPKICVEYTTERHFCKGRINNSNKDHKYSRDMRDWEWRCNYHHQKYHWEYGLVNPKGKIRRIYTKFGNIHKRAILLDGIIIEENIPYQRIAIS